MIGLDIVGSGDYWLCRRCGCMVGNPHTHEAWHEDRDAAEEDVAHSLARLASDLEILDRAQR